MKALKFLFIIVVSLPSIPVLASDRANNSAEKKSIEEFISPDGRIDLEAVRRSGYQGTLNLEGVEVRLDPQTGKPVVKVSATSTSPADPDDIYWDNSISTELNGLNDSVFALTVFDNKLIAAGTFDSAGGVAANHIASWDGTSWSALGTGMNDNVLALTVYNNQLIAGGIFDTADGVPASGIASWNGTFWSALGTGVLSERTTGVIALTGHNNSMIAGGIFDSAGSVEAKNIASWDNSAWSALGSGSENGFVFSLTVYNTKLIAGGFFSIVGVDTSYNIASWDGTSWSNLGMGMSGGGIVTVVYALVTYDNNLVAGGDFDSAGGIPANNIASWDGSSWSELGTGMSHNIGDTFIFDLSIYNNELIAGGIFDSAGGIPANNIASWDGLSWSTLGSGTNGTVNSLTVFENKLIVAGSFTSAGNKVSAFLAQWTKSSFICGDVKNDGTPSTVLDLTYLIDDIFRGGPEAPFPQSADLNGDGTPATVLDLTFLIDDIFRGGPAPTCGL